MTENSADRRLRVAFVMEQHVGHRTYATNLRSQLDSFERLDATWIPVPYDRPRFLPRQVPAALVAMLAGRREVRRGLRHVVRDVTVFNTQVPAALGGRRARRRPYVAITDVTPAQYDAMAAGYGHRPDGFAPLRAWKRHVNRRVFVDAARCVAWSTWAAASIEQDYGVPPERVVVIPPGVDTGVWAPSAGSRGPSPFRVLFVGGEFERKGGTELLAAFAGLPDDAQLMLVTKSPVATRDHRVRVIDDLGPNDARLVELYQSSDVFALPSRAETFGIAAAEASAVGLPVVAASVGGLPDIVEHDVTGMLVAPGDTPALAAALQRLYADPALRHRLGEAARRRALERFDAAVNAGRLAELIDAVASDAAPTG